jgi:Immunity protein 35
LSVNKTEARQIALSHVKELERGAGLELALRDDRTIERDFGWIFFYNSKSYVESGDIKNALAGNAPIVVTKIDGRLHETSTTRPLEDYLSKFTGYRAQT